MGRTNDPDYIAPSKVVLLLLFRNAQEIPTNATRITLNLFRKSDIDFYHGCIYSPVLPEHDTNLISIRQKFNELHEQFANYSIEDLTFCDNGRSMLNPRISETTAKEKQCFRLLLKCFGNDRLFAPFEQGTVIDCIIVCQGVKKYIQVKSSKQNEFGSYSTDKGAARNFHHCDAVISCFFDDDRDVNTTPTHMAVISGKEYFAYETKSIFNISAKKNSHILENRIDCSVDEAELYLSLELALRLAIT